MATATMPAATAKEASPAPPPAPPLRRATYVNVDQLVRTQYDINVERLTDELAKLKIRREKEAAGADIDAEGVDDDGGEDVPGGGEANKHTNAWSGTNLTVLPRLTSVAPFAGQGAHSHRSRLQPPRDGFNLCVLVGKVETVVDKYRVDGSRVLVAEVEVGDETGSISLRARDEQIDMLREVSNDGGSGGAVVLRNCTMELYQGKHLRLAVTKWGKMSVYPDGIESTPNPPSSMNRELNFSLVDLNIVARGKMPYEPPFPIPVATVHHKPQKQKQHHHGGHHAHHHAPHTPLRHQDESPSTPRNRGRFQQGSGGGGHHSHQKKKKEDWQGYHHRGGGQHQHLQHRPRSGSHGVNQAAAAGGGNQYVLQHQPSGGGGSGSPPTFVPQHMHYQQYSADAGSVYSYPSQQGDQQPPPPQSPHRPQFLPEDHYKRQQQILYQQYELQQRHAHQMHMLQAHQENQRRMLEQHQQIAAHNAQQQQGQQHPSSLLPNLSRAESHESSGGDTYPVHTPVRGMGQPPPPLPPNPSTFPPGMGPNPGSPPGSGMSPEYPYGSPLVPPAMTFQGGSDGSHQPPRGGGSMGGGSGSMPTYATIISPPMSPAYGPHAAPQAPPQYPDGGGRRESK